MKKQKNEQYVLLGKAPIGMYNRTMYNDRVKWLDYNFGNTRTKTKLTF